MKPSITLLCKKSPCFLPVKKINAKRNKTEDAKFYQIKTNLPE